MNNQTKKTGRLNGGKNITMEQYVYLLKEYVMYASDLGHSDDMVSEKKQFKDHETSFHLFFNRFRYKFPEHKNRPDESIWKSLRKLILQEKREYGKRSIQSGGSSLDEPVGDVYYPILYPLFSNCGIQSGVSVNNGICNSVYLENETTPLVSDLPNDSSYTLSDTSAFILDRLSSEIQTSGINDEMPLHERCNSQGVPIDEVVREREKKKEVIGMIPYHN